MKRFGLFVLFFILIFSFLVRLYRIDNPIADWHSWRQADTAAVARNFIKDGYNFFKPQVDNYVVTNERGLANPQRLFYVEPPFYQSIVFILYKIWGIHEYLARLVSVFFSLGSLIFIYFLTKKYFNRLTAFLSAFFFGFLPYNIFYGRVILPEPMMLFASIGSIYFVSEWLDKDKTKYLILAVIFTALSFLLKAYTLVLLLPIIYLIWRKYNFQFLRQKKIIIFILASILPLILWRYFISSHPEGVPSSTWLFNGGNLRFTGAFFHWIFAERLGKLIFAYGGIAFFVIGLILKPGKKEGWLFHWWLVAILSYFFVLATGNVTHDYYQVPFIAPAVIFLAKGTEFLIRGNGISRIISWPMVLVLVLAMLAFGWYEVRGFYWINHPEIVEAGRAVDKLTPPDSKVIAPYSRDVAFLYQTNRHGWAVVDRPIYLLISNEGATHYVSVNLDQATLDLAKQYKIVKQTPRFVILDLTKPQ